MKNRDNLNTIKNIFTILKFLLLIFIIVGIPILIYARNPEIITAFKSMEDVKSFIHASEAASVLICLALQIIQMIISVIPGQVIQCAVGYIYGFAFGALITIIGALIGEIITYYLARFLGRDAIQMIVGEKNFDKYVEKLSGKYAIIALFVIYLIPGLPKDTCGYIAGISDIKFNVYLIISMIARTPAMMCSVTIGVMLATGSYTICILLAAAAVILCALGVWKHEKIRKYLERMYAKYCEQK